MTANVAGPHRQTARQARWLSGAGPVLCVFKRLGHSFKITYLGLVHQLETFSEHFLNFVLWESTLNTLLRKRYLILSITNQCLELSCPLSSTQEQNFWPRVLPD